MLVDLLVIGVKKAFGHKNDTEGFDDQVEEKGLSAVRIFHLVIALLAMAGAVFLSWRCNSQAGESLVMKIVYGIVSALFSYLYLIYYLIYRIVMGRSC